MSDPVPGLAASLRSPTVKLISIGFLAFLLLVPIILIFGLVSERETRRNAATQEVASSWGSRQAITGPALVVPVTRRWLEPAMPKPTERTEVRHAIFLPERLRIRGTLESQTLSRGIFVVPVYRMTLTLDGTFNQPRLDDLGIAPAASQNIDVAWNRAHLVLGVSEVRAIQDQAAVTWNGTSVPFLPGADGFGDAGAGINAPVVVTGSETSHTFSIPLTLRGSVSAYFAPAAASTTVELTSNFQHPNFQGGWLPDTRAVSADGFRATWSVPFLGRSYPQAWLSGANGSADAIQKSLFGVTLQDPIDPYRMAERSVKYSLLFVLLTFGSVWLVEVMAGVRVHPVQYLLLGAALCLFYLLELSLSEHLRFAVAYAIAAAAVVSLIAAYSVVALKRVRRAAVVTLGATTLYGYLYVVLTNEDYALLIGSIGLFLSLALVMLITRRIDWYGLGFTAKAGR